MPLRLPIFVEVPILIIVSTIFFFLEKAAFRLQDPFENEPTEIQVISMVRTIEINITQLLVETELPPAIKAKSFYVL